MWDVGGQKSLRSYWKNYFESTDGVIWVVDSADKRRLEDCAEELHTLLQEEVSKVNLALSSILREHFLIKNILMFKQLAGATLLVFANKQDLPGALTPEEIKEVKNLLL